MRILDLGLDGLRVVASDCFEDDRGRFTRLFCETDLSSILQGRSIVQVNHSLSAVAGTLRGLHCQLPPFVEMKLIRCIRGCVWDVAVDLRSGSPTFLKWHAIELSPENNMMFVVPEGFAHGFQTLAPDSEMLYLHTAPYRPDHELRLNCLDPALGIAWPADVARVSPIDKAQEYINSDFQGVVI